MCKCKAILKRAWSYILKIIYLMSLFFSSKMTLLSSDITIQIVKCYWSSGAELVNFWTGLHSSPVWRQHSILLPTFFFSPQTQSKAKSSVAFAPPALTETPDHLVTQSGRVWRHGGGGGPVPLWAGQAVPVATGVPGGVPGRAAGGGGGAESCPGAGAPTPASSAPAPGWGQGESPRVPRGSFFYP